jgi:DNA-binding CsgD family transcriptional regulator
MATVGSQPNEASLAARAEALARACWLIAESTNMDEFRQAISAATGVLGASAFLIGQHSKAGSLYVSRVVCSLAPDQMNVLRTGFEADPLMAHLRSSHLPLYWDRQTFVDAGQIRLWDEWAEMGFSHGIAVPMHTSPTTLFMCAMDWRVDAPLSPEDRAWAVISVQTVALYAQPAAVRLWREGDLRFSEVPQGITPRQVECLLWASRGRTDSDIGRILEISARTARKHIDNIVEQLGASSRTEAVAIATTLGLLQAADLPTIDSTMPASMVEGLMPTRRSFRVDGSSTSQPAEIASPGDHSVGADIGAKTIRPGPAGA